MRERFLTRKWFKTVWNKLFHLADIRTEFVCNASIENVCYQMQSKYDVHCLDCKTEFQLNKYIEQN